MRLAHISREQDFRCIYCNIRMRWPRWEHIIKPTTVTKEHVVPRYHAGGDNDDNLAAACSRCNSMRGHLDKELFESILEKLFQVEFIRIHWHTTDREISRYIRKIFQYEVDAVHALKDREAAFRAIERREKYSLDVLLNSGIPLFNRVSPCT